MSENSFSHLYYLNKLGLDNLGVCMASGFKKTYVTYPCKNDKYYTDSIIKAYKELSSGMERAVKDLITPSYLLENNYLKKLTGNQKVDHIIKIIQNGDYTIIIDALGRKTITRPQDGEPNSYYIGFLTCFIKYLINDSKIYTDIIEFSFPEDKSKYYIYKLLESAIISQIGSDLYSEISNKFKDVRREKMAKELLNEH